MLEIRLVGDTQVRTPTAVFTGRDFGGVKPRRLLEVLALHLGTSVSKDRLADVLWDGEPPASWTATLEGYVSGLRRRLEPGVPVRSSAIATVSGGYLLDPDPDRVHVDVHAARHLAAQARCARAGVALPLLRQALELASGELLADAGDPSWVQSARHDHLRLRVDAATQAAQHALHLCRPELAAALADQALSLDPLAEAACRAAMQALWASGRTAEALRRHAELRAVLADELGVDPTPRTQAVLAQLLRDEPPPAVPLQRRGTDVPLVAVGTPERKVDVLVAALVVALRRTSPAEDSDDDPELVGMLEAVLRHVRGEGVLDRFAASA